MNKLLIIGYGYLGEAIDRSFSTAGWEVVRVGRSAENGTEVADVTDVKSLQELSSRIGKVDCIIHCASSGRGGAEAYQAVFERGVENITSVFPGVQLLFTSSSSVYAQIDGEKVDENSETKPDRETGKILLRAEKYVLSHGGCVMRLSGIYGEGRSVILKKFLRGELTIEEDGRRVLNQIHRADAAKAFLLMAEKKWEGEIFNVSETQPKNQLATIEWLCEHFGKALPESVPRDLNRKRGWTHKLVSSEKLTKAGWEPTYATYTDAVDSIVSSIETGSI